VAWGSGPHDTRARGVNGPHFASVNKRLGSIALDLEERGEDVKSGNGRKFDAIVIGAGHNGLTAAAYLQKAGLSVLVLEASPTTGGMTSTYPTLPGAPGHLVNEGAIQHSLIRMSSIARDLNLKRYGLREVVADPAHLHLGPDGESLGIWHDPKRTAEELKRFSRRDAAAWVEMSETLDLLMDAMLAYMRTHPTRPNVRSLLRGAARMARHPKQLVALSRFFTVSHEQIIDELFESPLVRGSLAQMPTFDWMRRDGTAWGMVYIALVHRTCSARYVGGTGALPKALEACLRDHGGSVRTSAAVEEILVDGGRVRGVRLASGEELHASTVLAACDPKTALARLLPTGVLPDRLEQAARHIPTSTTGGGHLKLNIALKGKLTLPRHSERRSDGLDVRAPLTCWHTLEEHVAGWDAAVRGDYPDRQPFLACIPTALDPTQAPEGQDTLWVWSGVVPVKPREESNTAGEAVAKRIIADCADYYDGIEDLIIDTQVLTPADIARRFHASDGNVFHVDPSLQRFGPLRPAMGLANYATPVDGLFLGSGGMHPSAGICGIPGQLAAKSVLGSVKRASRKTAVGSIRVADRPPAPAAREVEAAR
jgi:phytoene dehydrogenase-like protein